MSDNLFVLNQETDFQLQYLNFTDPRILNTPCLFSSLQFKPDNEQFDWEDMYAEKLSRLMISVLFFLTR